MKELKDQVAALKREQVILAAGELFYTKGFTHTSMDDIAAMLSIGKPMIYSYFPSKVALLAAVCSRTSHLVASLAETMTEVRAHSPAEQLRMILRETSLRIIGGSKGLAVLFREAKYVPKPLLKQLEQSDTKFREVMVNLLKQGKEAGQFHYDADERVMAQAISGMATWLFTWYREDGPLTAEEVAEHMSRVVLGMAGYNKEFVARSE